MRLGLWWTGLNLSFLLSLVLTGLVGGLITSLVGASGVMVIVPALSLLQGFTIHTSIGTSLMVDVIASLTVAYGYYRHGNIDLKPGAWIALGSIAGAQLGAAFCPTIPESGLGAAFGLMLIVSGVGIWKGGARKEAFLERFRGIVGLRSNRTRTIITLLLGFLIGVNGGVFGAGGGLLILLVLLFFLNYPTHKAVGTSTLIMAITATSGALGYTLQGNIDILAGSIISLGTILGGFTGTRFANLADEETFSKVVGAMFLVLGVFMIIMHL
ncbi:MAG: sulfite exporter TauE/SafE family protein [Candidatus Bathyarchaeia archaeon]